MSQHTTISIDQATLNEAKKQAKKDRISVSAAARMLLSSYAKGSIRIGATAVTENGFTPEFEEEALQAWKDAKKGKNISKPLSSIGEINEHLDNLK